jgi:hypothetical protein
VKIDSFELSNVSIHVVRALTTKSLPFFFLVIRTTPLLSGAASKPTGLALTRPLLVQLWMPVKLLGSLVKVLERDKCPFIMNDELLRIIIQVRSEDILACGDKSMLLNWKIKQVKDYIDFLVRKR